MAGDIPGLAQRIPYTGLPNYIPGGMSVISSPAKLTEEVHAQQGRQSCEIQVIPNMAGESEMMSMSRLNK